MDEQHKDEMLERLVAQRTADEMAKQRRLGLLPQAVPNTDDDYPLPGVAEEHRRLFGPGAPIMRHGVRTGWEGTMWDTFNQDVAWMKRPRDAGWRRDIALPDERTTSKKEKQ